MSNGKRKETRGAAEASAARSAGEDRSGNGDARREAPEALRLSSSDAAAVVDALNRAMEHETPREQAAVLLQALVQKLAETADSPPPRGYNAQLLLFDDSAGEAAPQLLDRVFVGPDEQLITGRSFERVQQDVDRWGPALDLLLSPIRDRVHQPFTAVVSELMSGDPAHSDHFRNQILGEHLEPLGFVDVLLSLWSCSRQRLLVIAVPRGPGDPPFNRDQRLIAELVLRAASPIADRQMFAHKQVTDGPAGLSAADQPGLPDPAAEALAGRELSQRQQQVLVLLLRGHSEKQVAREMQMSQHTIHSYIKQLYALFGVNSRGELLALFVDRRVLQLAASREG